MNSHVYEKSIKPKYGRRVKRESWADYEMTKAHRDRSEGSIVTEITPRVDDSSCGSLGSPSCCITHYAKTAGNHD